MEKIYYSDESTYEKMKSYANKAIWPVLLSASIAFASAPGAANAQNISAPQFNQTSITMQVENNNKTINNLSRNVVKKDSIKEISKTFNLKKREKKERFTMVDAFEIAGSVIGLAVGGPFKGAVALARKAYQGFSAVMAARKLKNGTKLLPEGKKDVKKVAIAATKIASPIIGKSLQIADAGIEFKEKVIEPVVENEKSKSNAFIEELRNGHDTSNIKKEIKQTSAEKDIEKTIDVDEAER